MRHFVRASAAIVWLLIVASAAAAQTSSNETVSRFPDSRRIVRQAGVRVEEAKGVLVSDPAKAEIRFEQDGYALTVVPYDRLTALHYEKSDEASKLGWPLRTTKHLLTIHYVDASGQPAAEMFRLADADSVSALDALEAETGRSIDRARARESFLGIPLRAAVGDRVKIHTRTGEEAEGIVTGLSSSALTLEESTAGPLRLDAASVKTITLTRSRGRDARRGFGIGAVIGGLVGGVMGRGLGGDRTSMFQGAFTLGAMFGGVGALTSALVPSYHYRAARRVLVSVSF